MLDKDVFADKMEDLYIAYPDWRANISNQEFMAFWYDKFKQYENDRFKSKVDNYINEVEFRPNIARLKNFIEGKSDHSVTKDMSNFDIVN